MCWGFLFEQKYDSREKCHSADHLFEKYFADFKMGFIAKINGD